MLRALNSIFALTFLVTLIYVLIVGVEKFTFGLLLASVVGVAVPVAISETASVLEIVIGTIEALVDGVLAILEFISGLLSGLFG